MESVLKSERFLYLFPVLYGILSWFYFSLLAYYEPLHLLAYIPDDAFYYFVICENMLNGYWFSFDTITYTNGFHPLWLFTIAPLTYLNSGLLSYILLAVSLMTGALLIIVKLIKELFGLKFALIFAILLSFNPFIFLFSANCLETSLLCLFISTLLYLFFTLRLDRYLHFIVIGLVSGLTFLSRTDSIFLLIALMLSFLILAKDKNVISKFKFVFTWISVAGIVSIPWILYNFVTFGNPVQESGLALTALFSRQLIIDYHWTSLQFVDNFFKLLFGNFEWLGNFSGYNYLLLLILLPYVLITLFKKGSQRQILFYVVYACYFFSIIFVAAYRMTPREWYIAPFIGLAIFLIAYLLISVHYKYNNISYRLITGISCVIAIGVICLNAGLITDGFYPHQEGIPKIVSSLNNDLSENDRFGSSDAGITGYYAKFHVINLDGLVNHQVYEYIKNGTVYQFLRDYNIQYFMIRDWMAEDWYMGEGTGLYYASSTISCNNNIGNTTHIGGVLKLLHGNDEIYNTYYKEQISPSDPLASKYFGRGWSISEKAVDAWSSGESSRIYLPLKNGKEYLITFTLHPVPNPTGYINAKVFVDGQYIKTLKVLETCSNYEIYISNPALTTTEITFEYENTYNLKKMGFSNDLRDLAVNLGGVSIREI